MSATATSSAWGEAFQLWRRSGSYDAIVTMGSRCTLFYGLLRDFLPGKRPRHVITEYFLPAHGAGGAIGTLKLRIERRVARNACAIIVHSKGEIPLVARHLDIPEDKVRCIPIPNTLSASDAPCPITDEGYILAAGRSHRDYETLLDAVSGLGHPVQVACGARQVNTSRRPSHVTVHEECSRARYLELLARCRLVVVPLKPVPRATGQVVILEAMALGKAVLATDVLGTRDYIRNNETGLLVPPNDAAGLHAAIDRLFKDAPLRSRLALAAQETLQTTFHPDVHAQALLLCTTPATTP